MHHFLSLGSVLSNAIINPRASHGDYIATSGKKMVFDRESAGFRPLVAYGEDEDKAFDNLMDAFDQLPIGTVISAPDRNGQIFRKVQSDAWSEQPHWSPAHELRENALHP